MKRLALTTIAALGLMAGAAAADPVYGTWKTIADDNGNFGHIKMAACGSKICGTLIKSFGSNGAEIASDDNGKKIIWDMKSDGGGAYSGGKVWSPDRDKTYNSRMQLSGNSLNIMGCVMGVCRDGGTWSRVN